MFTSADAIQKDNKDNAAISQDAQRCNAGLTGSTNNPDGAAAAECSFAMSEYSNTMSATAEQNVLQRRIHLAAYSDSAPQPVSGGSRSMFYYMFKCMVLKYFSKKGRAAAKNIGLLYCLRYRCKCWLFIFFMSGWKIFRICCKVWTLSEKLRLFRQLRLLSVGCTILVNPDGGCLYRRIRLFCLRLSKAMKAQTNSALRNKS